MAYITTRYISLPNGLYQLGCWDRSIIHLEGPSDVGYVCVLITYT